MLGFSMLREPVASDEQLSGFSWKTDAGYQNHQFRAGNCDQLNWMLRAELP